MFLFRLWVRDRRRPALEAAERRGLLKGIINHKYAWVPRWYPSRMYTYRVYNIYLDILWVTSRHERAEVRMFMSLMIISHCSSGQWGTFAHDAQRYMAPSCKNTEPSGDVWINCLTPSTSVAEHTGNFPYVWACTIFSLASCLHHDLAGNCTSPLTLKCLKSNFKLENVYLNFLRIPFSPWTFPLSDVLRVIMPA